MVSNHAASVMASEFGRTSFAAAALLTKMSSPSSALIDYATIFLQPSAVRMSPVMKVALAGVCSWRLRAATAIEDGPAIATFRRNLSTREINQNIAHQPGRESKKVSPMPPLAV
jgi:hypothetical protein